MSDCINRTKARTILGYSGATPTASNEYVTKEQCITMGADSSPLGKYKSGKELINLDDVVKPASKGALIYSYEPLTDTFISGEGLNMTYEANCKGDKRLVFNNDNSMFYTIMNGSDVTLPDDNSNAIEFNFSQILTPYNFTTDKMLFSIIGTYYIDEFAGDPLHSQSHFCVYGSTHHLKFGFTKDFFRFYQRDEVTTTSNNIQLNMIFWRNEIRVRVREENGTEWNTTIPVNLTTSVSRSPYIGTNTIPSQFTKQVPSFLMTIIEKFQMNWLH